MSCYSFSRLALVSLLLVLALPGCRSTWSGRVPEQGGYVTDGGGRALSRVPVGGSLHVAANNLRPGAMYEVRMALGDEPASSLDQAISFARVGTDDRGDIRSFALWHHTGVVGCSQRLDRDAELGRFRFRSFDEAERALRGRGLTISFHPVPREAAVRRPFTATDEEPASVVRVPLAVPDHPVIYPSRQDGCLVNARFVGDEDLYVSGRNFAPGERVAVSVVQNQRLWRVGDEILDVARTGSEAPVTAVADPQGRFSVRVWERGRQRRGVYDLVARRRPEPEQRRPRLAARDVVSYHSDSAMVFALRYPIGGPTMDIAGRPVGGFPYFQFADSFAVTGDTVWGAVDPTYVPDPHPGGTYAAYYVVPHRDVAGWDPGSGGATDLVDVSGGYEVMPVKAGCINGTDVPIWSSPLTPGQYDVVVDFGPSPAEDAASFTSDASYDTLLDFLDGADQIGFVVTEDPYELGPMPIGRASYSFDDFFGTLGGASDVDLRAMVRYPATAAGDDTPVAAGQHPLFLIEHGNHFHCRVATDGRDMYDVLAEYFAGTITYSELVALTHSHASCPQRLPNHLGYTRLLDILASHGVVAVSIDAYDLTGPGYIGVDGWITERGDLLLKHLELWSHLQDGVQFATYPDPFAGRFNGHLDLSKISLSGHSRGGEASVAAFLQNTQGFAINSVSSIAPVDFHGHTLPGVPYFVILPAADGDVRDLNGIQIYDRAGNGLSPLDATTKSGIHVYGANHNFFNTVWAGDGDDSSPGRDDYIAATDQQRLGEAFLAAFTRAHLLGEAVYDDMLRGRMVFPSTAGFKVYPFRHEAQHSRLEDGSGSAASPSGVILAPVSGPSVHATQAARVGWSGSSGTLTYTVPVPQRDASSFEVLSLRVAQTNASVDPLGQDFQVELVGGGQTRAVYTSRFDAIPPPYDHPDFTNDHNLMTTVRIPLHSYILNRSEVRLEDIDTVRLHFNGTSTGEIYVDDIAFSR